MIAWWWMPILLFAGIVIGALGAVVIALIGPPVKKGWWKKDE